MRISVAAWLKPFWPGAACALWNKLCILVREGCCEFELDMYGSFLVSMIRHYYYFISFQFVPPAAAQIEEKRILRGHLALRQGLSPCTPYQTTKYTLENPAVS